MTGHTRALANERVSTPHTPSPPQNGSTGKERFIAISSDRPLAPEQSRAFHAQILSKTSCRKTARLHGSAACQDRDYRVSRADSKRHRQYLWRQIFRRISASGCDKRRCSTVEHANIQLDSRAGLRPLARSRSAIPRRWFAEGVSGRTDRWLTIFVSLTPKNNEYNPTFSEQRIGDRHRVSVKSRHGLGIADQ